MAIAALESTQNARLKALRNKHAILSNEVEQAQRSPGISDDALKLLKKQKLMLKEQIEGIRENG